MGKSNCHVGGVLLIELVKARMRKSRKIANEMNLAALTPGQYTNYLMLLSNLRDSVLYIGNLFSLPQLALCGYITFHLLVWCGTSQLLPSGNVTFYRCFNIVIHYSRFLFKLLTCDQHAHGMYAM